MTFRLDQKVALANATDQRPMEERDDVLVYTGNPIATDTQWRVAQQTIYHDRVFPSAVILPVFPGENDRG